MDYKKLGLSMIIMQIGAALKQAAPICSFFSSFPSHPGFPSQASLPSLSSLPSPAIHPILPIFSPSFGRS